MSLLSITDAFACASDCERCGGCGHACERHPDRAWGGVDDEAGCQCGAPGIPCSRSCWHCGKDLGPWDPTRTPNPAKWCSTACGEAWLDADPKRREGLVSLADMTLEQANELLADVGLGLGVGQRSPS